MTTATNNLIRISIILSITFCLFLGITQVKANTFSEVTAGYGYTPVVNGTSGSWAWVAFNSNNLVNYGYNLGDTNYYNIDEFNIRFRPTGGFQRGSSYTINFTWDNYHPTIDTNNFYADWLLMTHTLRCYATSWSSASQTGSACFTSSNVSATQNGNNSIFVTITLVPSADFYGLILQNSHGSTITYYKSIGWEFYDIGYSYSSDGSQDIINNANQNTQNIINNQDSNTQDIIDNQNQNTQDIINSNKSCYKLSPRDGIFDGYLDYRGVENSNQYYVTTGYIDISNASVKVLDNTSTLVTGYTCFYSAEKTLIQCIVDGNLGTNVQVTPPNNSFYMRASIQKATNRPSFEICKNGNQAITDALTDTSQPDTSGLSNAAGWLPPGPVDSILNLPLTLLQSLNNAFSTGSCQPLVIHFPHIAREVPIPCMSTIWENFGLLPLFTWIGRVIGGILLYKYLINLYKWVDDTLTMRENNNFDDGSLG